MVNAATVTWFLRIQGLSANGWGGNVPCARWVLLHVFVLQYECGCILANAIKQCELWPCIFSSLFTDAGRR